MEYSTTVIPLHCNISHTSNVTKAVDNGLARRLGELSPLQSAASREDATTGLAGAQRADIRKQVHRADPAAKWADGADTRILFCPSDAVCTKIFPVSLLWCRERGKSVLHPQLNVQVLPGLWLQICTANVCNADDIHLVQLTVQVNIRQTRPGPVRGPKYILPGRVCTGPVKIVWLTRTNYQTFWLFDDGQRGGRWLHY